MNKGLEQAFSTANLIRAWSWTKTNPDPVFKNYFRHIYRAYSLTQEANLGDLRNRLLTDIYEPTHPSKIHFPKKSGLQRTVTLLNVEDQIVYQAMVNVVAEKLLPQVKRDYYVSVFGSLYAGKSNWFFYRDWRKGYRKFSEAMRETYRDGLRYTASFDLTACFDTIDHTILKHFLLAIRLEPEFCDRLNRYLRHWTTTSSQQPLYQGHGIPQGPLPSGLLAEVVLRYFDSSSPRSRRYRYFRYVDDIRLFSKTEKELRRLLVSLDLISKAVGLFPQSRKIGIHLVQNIEEEIKTISNPLEQVTLTPEPDQAKVRKRIMTLTHGLKVISETRFKYVLARALPNAKLSNRLLEIVNRNPHLFISIFNHLSKSEQLPRSTSKICIGLLENNDFYPAFTASLIRALRGRIHPTYQSQLLRYCHKILSRGPNNNNPELRAAVVSVLLQSRDMTWKQVKYNINWPQEWWVRTELIRYVDKDIWGEPNYELLINLLLRDRVLDVAIVAAELAISEEVHITKPVKGIHEKAQSALKQAGLIGKIYSSRCFIADAMKEVIAPPLAVINWRKVFGKGYKKALPKVARWRGYSNTDASAWVNMTDIINDLLLNALFAHDSSIGNYKLGDIGSVLNPHSRLAKKYPLLFDVADKVHKMRLESDLSHPVTKRTGRVTQPIEFKDLPQIKRDLGNGYMEMWGKW